MAKEAEQKHTTLLPPYVAVRLAWALTGQFAKPSDSIDAGMSATMADALLKDGQKRAPVGPELDYVQNATAAIRAAMRTLETLYKGRELNFQENEQLRSVYLENFRDNLQFGKKAQDFLKALPTMTISAGTGVFSLAQVDTLQGWPLALIGLAFAGFGFAVNAGFVYLTRERQQKLYIREDYERNLYYQQYINRVSVALISLYLDVDRAHWDSFKSSYPGAPGDAKDVVAKVLDGAQHTMCKYVHKHKREGRITPGLWTLCEVGQDAARTCPLWEDGATALR